MHSLPAAFNIFFVLLFLSLTIVACGNSGEKSDGPVKLETEMDKVSYSIGLQIGNNFKQNKIDINTDIFTRAIEDAMNGITPVISEEEMAAVMNKFQTDLTARQQKEFSEQSARNREQASLFLAENAGKQGVTTLPDSLQYEVMTDGTGAVPKLSDTVKVHYRGSLLDGTVFDSSKPDNPIELSVTGVIKGWTEALQLMKTGSKWKIYIPPELGYGERGYPPNIPPNALLIFEMELMEIVK